MSSLIPTLRWITIIVWLVWFVMYWNGGWRILVDIRKSTTNSDSLMDTLLMVTIALLTLFIIATGLLVTTGFPMVLTAIDNEFVLVPGFLLTLFGMGGTLYCRRYLSRFWTAETSLQPDHQVADSGPYNQVRHPIYTGTIVIYSGTILVFPTWWNMVAVLLVILAYARKAIEEDHFLAENLPGYLDYQKRVPHRLIPRLW